ncbi:hypothetical protein MPSEU_000213100 [Mayamaea pseudoterrestris]|nr:hypothetical protein MPSEU_000213100 [Mayamaea pseudoterrestris]
MMASNASSDELLENKTPKDLKKSFKVSDPLAFEDVDSLDASPARGHAMFDPLALHSVYANPLIDGRRRMTTALDADLMSHNPQSSSFDETVADDEHDTASEQWTCRYEADESIDLYPIEEPTRLNASNGNARPLNSGSSSHYNALVFVQEHRIFLRAALDLLTERDVQAPELGMMDPIVLKSGSLKKASSIMSGLWSAKFVEIRRGMFSYYENKAERNEHNGNSHGELLRTDIPLKAGVACRAVKLHTKALNLTPGGYIFELNVNGTKRLWMANTREDRSAWIQSIMTALVGGSVTRGDTLMDHKGVVRTPSSASATTRNPFRHDLRSYNKLQHVLRKAESRHDYLAGLQQLMEKSLKVPVKWIAKEGENADAVAFREEAVNLSVDQLWKDLQRDTVRINGRVYRGDTGHGAEKIVGGLTRDILTVGRRSDSHRAGLPESRALAYARDVLLSGNRTRSGGDSYFCVSNLCKNNELIVVVPSGEQVDPVVIDVVEDDSDVALCSRVVETSGWIKTRNKSQKSWRRLFFVLSEGTLSYYQYAAPRPHRLRGQILLQDAQLQLSTIERDDSMTLAQFVLTLSRDGSKERLLLFSSAERLLDWTYALECTMKLKAGSEAARKQQRQKSEKRGFIFPTSRHDILSLAEESTKQHADNIGLDRNLVESRLAGYAKRTSSSILITVRAKTKYNICTTDPQGDGEDTWATIKAYFLQSFRVNGGVNGRIMRGEEIVRLSVADCLPSTLNRLGTHVEDAEAHSPNTRRRSLRIFRNASNDSNADETLSAAPSFEDD